MLAHNIYKEADILDRDVFISYLFISLVKSINYRWNITSM